MRHTRTDIKELRPGREMDALVHVHVIKEPCACENRTAECAARNHYHYGSYSTDIAAAWRVVERLGLSVVKLPGDVWWAGHVPEMTHFGEPGTGFPDFDQIDGSEDFECGDTAPEAICRKALVDALGLPHHDDVAPGFMAKGGPPPNLPREPGIFDRIGRWLCGGEA